MLASTCPDKERECDFSKSHRKFSNHTRQKYSSLTRDLTDFFTVLHWTFNSITVNKTPWDGRHKCCNKRLGKAKRE